MNHNIGPKLKRPAVDGSGKGIVHDQRHAVAVDMGAVRVPVLRVDTDVYSYYVNIVSGEVSRVSA